MSAKRGCNFEALEQAITAQFHGGKHSIHGPSHWRRVEQNGLRLCERTQADALVVRLFAWFHDAKRINDLTDPRHGRRGAEYAVTLRGTLFDLEDDAFDRLLYACVGHTDELHSDDTTIGTCWDADRLDLGRVGAVPLADFMSTQFGKEVAIAGSFSTFVSERK